MGLHSDHILSLCSGAGGLDLGVRLALPRARTVCYVEIEAYAIDLLVRQMEEGALDAAPIHSDVTTFPSGAFHRGVDGIIGGYPCQPFSVAGKQRGTDDHRHLWPHIKRHIDAIKPRWCFFENVANHLRIGFDVVARDLQDMGYRVAATLVSAEEVGAPHRRERLFIMAYSHREGRGQQCSSYDEHTRHAPWHDLGRQGEPLADTRRSDTGQRPEDTYDLRGQGAPSGACGTSDELADAARGRVQKLWTTWFAESDLSSAQALLGRDGRGVGRFPPRPDESDKWRAVLAAYPDLAPTIESPVRRVADGPTTRVDRLRLLGNAVVPLQAAYAFQLLRATV